MRRAEFQKPNQEKNDEERRESMSRLIRVLVEKRAIIFLTINQLNCRLTRVGTTGNAEDGARDGLADKVCQKILGHYCASMKNNIQEEAVKSLAKCVKLENRKKISCLHRVVCVIFLFSLT